LNGSLAFLDSFAVANDDFIRQEEEKIKKVKNFFPRISQNSSSP